jgi:hypothetical protein
LIRPDSDPEDKLHRNWNHPNNEKPRVPKSKSVFGVAAPLPGKKNANPAKRGGHVMDLLKADVMKHAGEEFADPCHAVRKNLGLK